MPDNLIVYKANQKVGTLSRADDSYFFFYAASWLEQDNPAPLSISLPLKDESFSSKETRPFFSNLLPEGQLRDHYAAKHRVSSEDDFALLAALAGDCAGAVTLYPEGVVPPDSSNQYSYHQLSEEDVDKLFEEAFIMDPTFLGVEERTRLSLAGVQDKLPIKFEDGKINLPLDGSPSTHILKPQNPRYKFLVENEAFCMALAKEMGLDVPESFIFRNQENAYIVERYDRRVDESGRVERIHQEDFCQALGYSYRLKYEEEGGPGHKECFELVKSFKNPLADKIKLINLTVFNYLISNYDCHSKNISLIYDDGVVPSLAPHYDLVCVGAYDLSSKFAMKIGGAASQRNVSREAWENFAEEIDEGSPKPVLKTVENFASKITDASRKVATKMVGRYGDNAIYSSIINKISAQAEIALRKLEN